MSPLRATRLQMKENGKWRLPRSSIKRYWKGPWTRFFDTLLDGSGGGRARDLSKLADEMEQYLDDKPRRQALKQALQSQFAVLREARMLPR